MRRWGIVAALGATSLVVEGGSLNRVKLLTLLAPLHAIRMARKPAPGASRLGPPSGLFETSLGALFAGNRLASNRTPSP
jgi:hypothetical protein